MDKNLETRGINRDLANKDVGEWLADNKLQTIEEIFKKREVSLDEIAEFTERELNDFANELQLDILQKKRFIKAVQELQPKSKLQTQSSGLNISSSLVRPPSLLSIGNSPSTQSQTSLLPQSAASTLTVSPQEQKAIQKLSAAKEKTLKLATDVQNSFEELENSANECKTAIDQMFDALLKELETRQNFLHSQVDVMKNDKIVQLAEQSQVLKEYNEAINEGKLKYESYVNDPVLDLQKRKKLIMEMSEVILTFPGIRLVYTTQPKMGIKDYRPPLISFAQKLFIDDCDEPMPLSLYITKVKNDSIRVEWRIHNRDLQLRSLKPILEISVEWTPLPKGSVPKSTSKIFKNIKNPKDEKNKDYNNELSIQTNKPSKLESLLNWFKGSKTDMIEETSKKDLQITSDDEADKDRKKDKNKKKKKDDDADNSDEDSDSDDDEKSDESGSDDNSKNKDKKKKKKPDDDDDKGDKSDDTGFQSILDNIGEAKLKWKANNGVIKPTKTRYKIKELKEELPYAVRIRAKNSSGWSLYSSPLIRWTPKLAIDSKILTGKEKAQLLKFVPKASKYKWSLLFRASKDGFSSYTFHSKCNDKTPTVVVVYSKMKHVFGGYTEAPWTSNSNYGNDANSFIFLLRSSRKGEKPEKFICKNTTYSTYNNSSYGPTFGGGHDFYLCDNCNTVNSSYSNFGHSYGSSDSGKLAGAYNFLVEEYEVYHLKK